MPRSRVAQQLVYLLPGAFLTYWLNTHSLLVSLLYSHEAGFSRTAAGASLFSGAIVVALFLYVLLFPILKGVQQPNYRQWRADGELSVVIPLLTASMVAGWSILWSTLAYCTELGALKGFLGAIGLYLSVFGILGLIPVPASARARSHHPQ